MNEFVCLQLVLKIGYKGLCNGRDKNSTDKMYDINRMDVCVF